MKFRILCQVLGRSRPDLRGKTTSRTRTTNVREFDTEDEAYDAKPPSRETDRGVTFRYSVVKVEL